MANYLFALDNGGRIEVLGAMPLADDEEAVAFGKLVIRDLQRGADQGARYAMLITEDERTVGSIPV
jgi:hypothetical protein